jgi:hypothetical protein
MGKTSVAHANFLVRVKIIVMGERPRVFLEIVHQHHPDFALEYFPTKFPLCQLSLNNPSLQEDLPRASCFIVLGIPT